MQRFLRRFIVLLLLINIRLLCGEDGKPFVYSQFGDRLGIRACPQTVPNPKPGTGTEAEPVPSVTHPFAGMSRNMGWPRHGPPAVI